MFDLVRRRVGPGLLLCGCCLPMLRAQGPTWASPQEVPAARAGHAAAFDVGRGRTIVYGGNSFSFNANDTWELDGSVWIQRVPATVPTPGVYPTMAHDQGRGETWLSNVTFPYAQAAWRWNGNAWSPAPSPPVDPQTPERLFVWHGGANPGLITTVLPTSSPAAPGQTWRFDGTAWVQVGTYAAGAGPAHGARTAFVPLTGRTYAWSGDASGSSAWAWDGASWQPVTQSGAAVGAFHVYHSVVWSGFANRLVSYAGTVTFVGEVIGPTHVHWTAVPNVDPTTGQVHPPLRRYESLVFDSRHFGVRMLGGWESDGPTSTWFADQYRWEPTPTGGSWQLVSPVTTTPTPRVYTDMAFDAPSGRMVMCAGRGPFSLQNDTWTFDGKTWTDHGPSSNVTPRMQPAVAHAPSLGTVLFGGGTGTGTYFADTWFWAGADWLPSLLSGAPPARMGHDMVFDSVRNEIVLHGGYDGATLADTWVLRPSSTFGTQWLPLTTIGTPPIPRQSHAMAFDARRGCVVVFGGANQHGQFLGDTWELVRGFLGAQWVQRVLSPSPPARWAHKMDYDPARGVVVMTGGYGNPQCGNYCASHLNDVWEYDGNSWQQRSPSTTLPTGREGAAFAYDSQRQRFVLQCGSGNPMFPSATWYYTVR